MNILHVTAITVGVAAILFGITMIKRDHGTEATLAPATVTINPEHTDCTGSVALERAGWRRVSKSNSEEVGDKVRAGKARWVPFKHMECVDYSSCPKDAPPGCILKTFYLREKLWEPVRLPARAVQPYLHKVDER